MPTMRIPMHKFREILRLKYDAQLSHRQIARAMNVSQGAVSKYVSLAQACGLGWPLPDGLDDAALEARLFARETSPSHYREPDFGTIHQELKRKGVTRQLLWAEYVAEHPESAYRYTQFCTRYRDWLNQQRRSLRQQHRAGEKLFIDYAGPTVPVIDAQTGEVRSAQVFVAVLGASNYTYAEATWGQSLPEWIGSHIRAFHFFGGVVALLVPDNLRAGVARACRYEPEPNATYAEMAAYYGTAILPTRPYKPKDKAKAEVAVQIVERWILARLRHQTFFTLAELNTAIAQLLGELNERLFQRLPGNRREAFEHLDRPALRPLPPSPYVYAEWKRVRVGSDYHIEVAGHLYSVPHRLVGQRLDVRLTDTTVEVLAGGQRVASHARQPRRGVTTVPEHMPEAHRQHQHWTPGRFLQWAAAIGPHTLAVVQHLLERRAHPEQGYRACLGLLSHARHYGHARLEAACARAQQLGAPSYRSISAILQHRLDEQPLPESFHAEAEADEETTTSLMHGNVRGPGYYH